MLPVQNTFCQRRQIEKLYVLPCSRLMIKTQKTIPCSVAHIRFSQVRECPSPYPPLRAPWNGTVLDSTPSIPESLSVERGFRITIVNGFLDSLSCFLDSKAKDSGFNYRQNIPGFRNPDSLTWLTCGKMKCQVQVQVQVYFRILKDNLQNCSTRK